MFRVTSPFWPSENPGSSSGGLLEWIGEKLGPAVERGEASDKTEHGVLQITWPRGRAGEEEPWLVDASGGYLPNPYRGRHGKVKPVQFLFKHYVDCLDAEVRAARGAAARIAGALGGLFVVALQTYGRFVG